MTERTSRVSVRILEKEYQVACLPEERSELLDSAEYLNVKMREIRDGGNIVGLDRIAVMAALNLAHELLKLRGRGDAVDTDVSQKIRQLRERVESALSRGQQLELLTFSRGRSLQKRMSAHRLRYGAACGVRHVSGYLSTLT